MNESQFEKIIIDVIFTVAEYYSFYYNKKKKKTFILSDHAYIKKILNNYILII